MYQELSGVSYRHFDASKKMKFSSVEIGLTVARPTKAKQKICLSLLVHLNGVCLDELYAQTHH